MSAARRLAILQRSWAAMRGDALLAKGDVDGLLVWLAIVRAIERLQAKIPAGDEVLH